MPTTNDDLRRQIVDLRYVFDQMSKDIRHLKNAWESNRVSQDFRQNTIERSISGLIETVSASDHY